MYFSDACRWIYTAELSWGSVSFGLRARVCMHPYDGAAVATDCKQTNRALINPQLEKLDVNIESKHVEYLRGSALFA
jgi:hypothetical protein